MWYDNHATNFKPNSRNLGRVHFTSGKNARSISAYPRLDYV